MSNPQGKPKVLGQVLGFSTSGLCNPLDSKLNTSPPSLTLLDSELTKPLSTHQTHFAVSATEPLHILFSVILFLPVFVGLTPTQLHLP